jgi:hypothetical protein
MPLGIGIGLASNLRPLKAPISGSGAFNLLGNEANGFAVDWTDNSYILKRAGSIVSQGVANSLLTVTGTLTSGATGAHFDASNNAYLDMSGFSDLATYRATNTVYSEFSLDAVDSILHVAVSFSDTVTGNNSSVRVTGGNAPAGAAISATVTVANIAAAGTPTANTFYKYAFASQLDNYDFAWASVAGTHDNLGAMPVNPVRCYFGVQVGVISPVNGRIKRAMILPRKMTLAELQTRTT